MLNSMRESPREFASRQVAQVCPACSVAERARTNGMLEFNSSMTVLYPDGELVALFRILSTPTGTIDIRYADIGPPVRATERLEELLRGLELKSAP